MKHIEAKHSMERGEPVRHVRTQEKGLIFGRYIRERVLLRVLLEGGREVMGGLEEFEPATH